MRQRRALLAGQVTRKHQRFKLLAKSQISYAKLRIRFAAGSPGSGFRFTGIVSEFRASAFLVPAEQIAARKPIKNVVDKRGPMHRDSANEEEEAWQILDKLFHDNGHPSNRPSPEEHQVCSRCLST